MLAVRTGGPLDHHVCIYWDRDQLLENTLDHLLTKTREQLEFIASNVPGSAILVRDQSPGVEKRLREAWEALND